MDETPTVIVVALVRGPDGRVIAVQRASDGKWTLPGGPVEQGELLVVAAQREILEETGLTVDGLRIIGFHEVPRAADGSHYVVFWLEGNTTQTELQNPEPAEQTDVRWAELQSLPKPHAGQFDAFWSNTFTPINGYVRPSRFLH